MIKNSMDFLDARPFREAVGLKRRLYKAFISQFQVIKSIPPHYHPELEIIVPLGVTGQTYVTGRKYTLAESNCYIIPSNAVHSFTIGPGGQNQVLAVQINCKECLKVAHFFKESQVQEFLNSLEQCPIVLTLQSQEMRATLKHLSQLSQSPPHLNSALSDLECIFRILRLIESHGQTQAKPQQTDDRIRRIITVIETCAHEPVSLDLIAQKSALSKFHLCRVFKKSTGLTVQSYINQLRINRASMMLASGKNVTETCYACGFESLSYFITVFKKIMQQTPKQWARQRLNNSGYAAIN